MPNEVVGAIDQGTTGTRFVLIDHEGRILNGNYETHSQHYPETGWVEHDLNEIWETTQELITDTIASSPITPNDIRSIGITNQRETTCFWNPDTGEPVANAIVWQDRRTTERIEELKEAGHSSWIREKTGLPLDSYFSASKVEWFINQLDRPAARSDHSVFGTIDSWLIHKLTGKHVTDVTNASRTMLFNIHSLSWDEELLELFDVPKAVLPEVHPSSHPTAYGTTTIEGVTIPITGVLGDQQAALFGQACFDPGQIKNTIGTGSFLLQNTGQEPVQSEHELVTTIAYQLHDDQPQYALEGSNFVTGAAIEWLKDISLLPSVEESGVRATNVDSTNGVYFVPAFTGLGAPYWDGRARGTIVGLTRDTDRDQLIRAALESIAYQTKDVVLAMQRDSDLELNALRLDGGAASNNALCQFHADILQSPVHRAKNNETTSLGAAYVAGIAAGYWDSLESLRSHWESDRVFTPELSKSSAEAQYADWKEAISRAKNWA